MKLSYSKKILILSLVLFLGVIAFDIIFTNLLLKKINSINNKVEQLTLSAQERERELNLKETIINSAGGREKLETNFVGAGDSQTVDFVAYLESLAKTEGVRYSTDSISYEPVPELSSSESVSLIRLRSSISGSWNNVFSFLQLIENLPKIVTINNISLDVNPSDADTKTARTWSANIDFSVVRLKN